MMDECLATSGPAFLQRLLQGIQNKVSMRRPTYAPAYNPPGVRIDDKRHIDETRPGRYVREVGKPQPVRRWGVKLAVDLIQRTSRRLVAAGYANGLTADHSMQAHLVHQPSYCATRDTESLPL